MVHVRPYDGPLPRHPMQVVPADPSRCGALVRVRGWEVAVADPVEQVRTIEQLGGAAAALGWDAARTSTSGPPFTGGLVGYISDDVSPELMGLGSWDHRPGPVPLPPLWFGDHSHAACQDPSGRWWVVGRRRADLVRAEALLREGAGGRRPAADRPPLGVPSGPSQGWVIPGWDGPAVHAAAGAAWTTIDRGAHSAAVRRIQGWIADGDVYQVNLTLHVAAPWEGSPRALALGLFGASHGAAHAAYLHAPGAVIASISPETFLRMDGRRAQVRPIKGTRRRHPDPARDQALAEDLLAARKDGAEHVMIVDLERNDLGRVSEVGSVVVPELMALEGHPTVWHLTSTVEGRVRADVPLADLLAALFPCGSVTGAPKRMAVERIRQVEPWRRGVYCGAIGVISRGLVDLSVAIRTAVVHQGRAWYGTGGGIVADSDPDAEWDEAMAKAAPFFTATGTTPPA